MSALAMNTTAEERLAHHLIAVITHNYEDVDRRSMWRHTVGLDGNGHGQIEPPTPAL